MNNKITNILAQILSILSMAAGAFGVLFCFVFLWSSRIEDLVAAGLPFVAGTILFGSGLISFALLNRTK